MVDGIFDRKPNTSKGILLFNVKYTSIQIQIKWFWTCIFTCYIKLLKHQTQKFNLNFSDRLTIKNNVDNVMNPEFNLSIQKNPFIHTCYFVVIHNWINWYWVTFRIRLESYYRDPALKYFLHWQSVTSANIQLFRSDWKLLFFVKKKQNQKYILHG